MIASTMSPPSCSSTKSRNSVKTMPFMARISPGRTGDKLYRRGADRPLTGDGNGLGGGGVGILDLVLPLGDHGAGHGVAEHVGGRAAHVEQVVDPEDQQ